MNQTRVFQALAIVSNNDTGHLIKRLMKENKELKETVAKQAKRLSWLSKAYNQISPLFEAFREFIENYSNGMDFDLENMENGEPPYFSSSAEIQDEYPEAWEAYQEMMN